MAAAASEPVDGLAAEDWRRAADWDRLTFTPAPRPGARGAHPATPDCVGVHSYLADGAQACWRPGVPGVFALDVERATAPPPHLAARWAGSSREFWEAWVTTEVVAKLTGTPVLVLAARGVPASCPGVETVVKCNGDLVACYGRFVASASAGA
jgi:hypothetical protein